MSPDTERRRLAGISEHTFERLKDAIIEEICENPPSKLLNALDERRSERVYAWIGKRTVALALYILGTLGIGAFAIIKYLEAKGVM